MMQTKKEVVTFSPCQRQESRNYFHQEETVTVERNSSFGSRSGSDENANIRGTSGQAMLADVQSVERLRTLVSNIIQSASRTSGQIRELLEASKIIERSSQQYLHPEKESSAICSMDCGAGTVADILTEGENDCESFPQDNAGSEVECLQQKVKSTKRKLRKWRQFARSTLAEICPHKLAEIGDDLTPGTLKTACDAHRELKMFASQQRDKNFVLYHEIQDRDVKIAEMKKLIDDLLRNSNGIRVPVDFHMDEPGDGICSGSGEIVEKEIKETHNGEETEKRAIICKSPTSSEKEGIDLKKLASHNILDIYDGTKCQLRVYQRFGAKESWIRMGFCTAAGFVFGAMLRPKHH